MSIKHRSAFFAFLATVVFAAVAKADNAPVPFKIGSHTSRAIQTYTGINYVTGKVASLVVGVVLHHELGGSVKAHVSTYSFTDLLAGKIKKVNIKLKNPELEGIKLAHLEASTKTPLWYQWRKSHKFKKGLQNPLLVEVKGCVTNDNLSYALANPQVSTAVHMIKVNLPGLGQQQLQFLDPKVNLEQEKITIATTLNTLGAAKDNGIQLLLAGAPYLNGSKILVKNLEMSSPEISNPKEFSIFTESLFNPLFDFGKLDRKDHAFRLTNMQIIAGKCNFGGNLLMAPR